MMTELIAGTKSQVDVLTQIAAFMKTLGPLLLPWHDIASDQWTNYILLYIFKSYLVISTIM